MKILSFLLSVSLILVTSCIIEQNEPDPEPECSAIVKGEIYTSSGGGITDDKYSIDLEVINTGDRVLFSVSVPYTVHFVDGSNEEGTASWVTMDLNPGATVSQILALLASPDVGLSYKFFKGEISSLQLGEPSQLCKP